MINQTTKDKITALQLRYAELSKGNEQLLKEIAIAEIPEMVYNSNAIENSTLTLEDTEKILTGGELQRKVNIREVFETKNLAKITETLLQKPNQQLTNKLILSLQKTLLTNIDDKQLIKLRLPPVIIQNKSKHSEYYPLFSKYQVTMKFDGFTAILAVLLQEALHKRITMLTAKKIIPLSVWAKNNNIKPNIATNKAKRQTIPAFRLRQKWVIDEDYKEVEP